MGKGCWVSPEQGREAMGSDCWTPAPRGRRKQGLSLTLPSKWIFLLRWMSSSVLFMDCTLELHSCTSWGWGGESFGLPPGEEEPTALAPKLTSLSALKALVAMSSSWEPGAVRFKMFWWERDMFLRAVVTSKAPMFL